MTALSNWAGNLRYRATRLHEPASIAEVQQIVRSGRKLRVLGTRHSFSDIADTAGELLSMARMPRIFELDARHRTVTIDGAVRYGDLCAKLETAGFALPSLASLPHISVAGACATATHGSGDRFGNLATAVSAVGVITADGEARTFHRDGDRFAGAVVSLGGLGVVVKLTLDLEPTFRMRQDVYEGLPLATLVDHFDAITSAADSVSLFTTWRGSTMDQVWLKRRVPDREPIQPPFTVFGATPAAVALHPIPGLPAEACTPQLGVVGPWHERLPHFRMEHTPSAGAELQSEYIVARRHATAAVMALDRIRARLAPVVQVSEIRTIAADDLWLSPSFGQASVALHFTWVPDRAAVRDVMAAVEAALEPFAPRPHWGKLSAIAPDVVRSRYPRLSDFTELARSVDPDGKFRNDFLERYVFGAGQADQPAMRS